MPPGGSLTVRRSAYRFPSSTLTRTASAGARPLSASDAGAVGQESSPSRDLPSSSPLPFPPVFSSNRQPRLRPSARRRPWRPARVRLRSRPSHPGCRSFPRSCGKAASRSSRRRTPPLAGSLLISPLPFPCKGVVAKPAVSDRAIFAIRHDLIWQGQITIFPVLRQCSHSRVQRQLKDCSVGGHRRARPSAMGTCPAPPRRNHRHSPRSHSAVCCSCGVFTSRLAERNDCNEMMSSKSD